MLPPPPDPVSVATLFQSPGPALRLAQGLTEITGPLLGPERVTAADADLTTRHRGEPLGERIIVSGRVLDSGGSPVPDPKARGRMVAGFDLGLTQPDWARD